MGNWHDKKGNSYSGQPITREELEANKKYGWYVKDGVVYQVMDILKDRTRVVGKLIHTKRVAKPHSTKGRKKE